MPPLLALPTGPDATGTLELRPYSRLLLPYEETEGHVVYRDQLPRFCWLLGLLHLLLLTFQGFFVFLATLVSAILLDCFT